jgi:hypothetical protein
MGWVVNTTLPATLPVGKKTWHQLCRRLGGPHGQYGQLQKILIQAVVSHYTDRDIPAHLQLLGIIYQGELVSPW